MEADSLAALPQPRASSSGRFKSPRPCCARRSSTASVSTSTPGGTDWTTSTGSLRCDEHVRRVARPSPGNQNLPVGPGLNAAFMERCGWLDRTRVAPAGQVALRPLHRRDLHGPLYAQVGPYYVEYRASRRWDSGFQSVVLVHYIMNETSYLVAELRAGFPAFTFGDPRSPFEPHGSISVSAIDDASETATITTVYDEGLSLPFAGPAFSLFGSEFGGGAGLVFVGGKLVRIPPRSPAFQLVEAAVALASLQEVQVAPALKTAAQAEDLCQDHQRDSRKSTSTSRVELGAGPHDHGGSAGVPQARGQETRQGAGARALEVSAEIAAAGGITIAAEWVREATQKVGWGSRSRFQQPSFSLRRSSASCEQPFDNWPAAISRRSWPLSWRSSSGSRSSMPSRASPTVAGLAMPHRHGARHWRWVRLAARTGNPEVDAVERFHFIEYGLIRCSFTGPGGRRATGRSLLCRFSPGSRRHLRRVAAVVHPGPRRRGARRPVQSLRHRLWAALQPRARSAAAFDACASAGCRGVEWPSLAAIALVVFGAFIHSVHLGYEIKDAEAGVFRSRYTTEELANCSDARARRGPRTRR